MKISCNDCRRQLGEVFENQDTSGATASAQPQVSAEVQQHLAECPACREELALLTKAREEMRAFPVLAAPGDLRSRIRQQLEAEPIQAAATTAATTPIVESAVEQTPPIPAKTAAPRTGPVTFTQPTPFQPATTQTAANEWQVAEPTKFQTWLESFRAFLRHPSNVAWMSCTVILLFYIVTLSRPRPTPSGPDSPYTSLVGQYRQEDDNEDNDNRSVFVAPPLKQPSLAARPGAKAPAPPPAGLKLPENMQPPSLLTPFNDMPLPATKDAPPAQKDELPADAVQAPYLAKSPESANRPAASPPPNAKREPSGAAKPQAETPRNDSTTFAMRPRMADNNGFDAARSAPAPAGPTGPPGPSRQDAPMAAMMRRSDSRADESEASSGAQSSSPLSVREINTRITPPRRVAFGQVSVNLPEGARFSDGSRARVIWRGAAEANEPIDLSFTIQALPGQQTVKITLQEVRNNDAQMVAYKSLQINGDR